MAESTGQGRTCPVPGAVTIRSAVPEDAPVVAGLLRQLGYDMGAADAAKCLGALGRTPSDQVLVATGGGTVIGVMALHWTRMLQYRAPIARITTLVVDEQARGRGIGRLLVEAGMGTARLAGCEVIELTTSLRREGAQAFYRSLGFEASSYRMHRPVPDQPSD